METNALLDLVDRQQARAKDASDLLVGTTIQTQQKADEVLQGMQNAIGTQANNQAIVLRTQQLATMEAQRKASKALEIIGGEESLFKKIEDVNAAGEKLKADVAEMARLRNTSFFGDGPLEWIKAQIELPYSEQRVKDTVVMTQAARTAAMDINNAIQETVKTTNATTRTVTDISINAATDALKAEYDFKAGQVQLDRLRNSLIGVEAIAKAEDGALRRAYDAVNMQRAEQQWELTLKKFDADRADQAWLQAERANATRTRLEQQQFDESLQYKINLARNSRGEPPLTGTEWRSFKEFTPKEEIYQLMKLGERAAETGIPFIANSPAGTAKVFLQNPTIKFEDLRQQSANLIFQAINDLGQIRGSKDLKTQAKYAELLKDKTGQQAEAFINSRVQELITQYTANTDAPTNPFNIGDMSAFLGNGDPKLAIPEMASLEVSQKVLLPAVKAGVKLDSPAVLTKVVTDAIKSKQITSQAAISGITSLYLRANAMHRSAMGLKALGIVMPEGSQGYRATVGGQIVDMTDEVQVGRALTNQMFNTPEALRRIQLEGVLPGLIRLGREAAPSIDRSNFQFGSDITNTPENYRIGVDRAREDVINRGKE